MGYIKEIFKVRSTDLVLSWRLYCEKIESEEVLLIQKDR